MPGEGAFFTAVRAQLADEEETQTKARRRPATAEETADYFGLTM